jgi:multiple sugar transport system substrate-binding protein
MTESKRPEATGAVRTFYAASLHRRRLLQAALTGSAALAVGLRAPAVRGQAKPFAGVTITGASFQSVFFEFLKPYIPEFEASSGMKVDLQQQAFPVYNQRMDLELSTNGSGYDFCNVTFIYSGRWIGAGWVTPLDAYVNDPNKTAPDWDPEDFVGGAQSSLVDAKGQTYGFAWEAGAMLMAMARGDLIEQAGLKPPTTFDELIEVAKAVHKKEGVAAFVADKLHHWNWIPYLMGMGGKVFQDPPGDLHPVLDTPEAAESAEWYAHLLSTYCPSGVLSYTDDQAMRAQLAGRANIRTQALTWMTPLANSPESKVKETVRYALMPHGPAGDFPGSNSHGLGIPAGSKKKDAAWAFIQWALSKETLTRLIKDNSYGTVCRRSIIESPEFKQKLTFNGQDVAALFLQVLELGGKTGYMKYRTVPVFPQVGDKINKAIERIATGQANGKEAMKQAQEEALADLQKAGVKL